MLQKYTICPSNLLSYTQNNHKGDKNSHANPAKHRNHRNTLHYRHCHIVCWITQILPQSTHCTPIHSACHGHDDCYPVHCQCRPRNHDSSGIDGTLAQPKVKLLKIKYVKEPKCIEFNSFTCYN